MEHHSLIMRNESLQLPSGLTVPEGYQLRYYAPGDEQAWRDIHLEADRYNRDRPDLFRHQFGTSDHVLSWRQIYLCKGDRPVGTVTAWYDDAALFHPNWGRLHWLALLPEEHGKGLGELLVGACLQCLCQLGHRRAYLKTDSRRVAALNLYLKYGFRPEVRTLGDENSWRQLAPRLRYPSFP